MTGDEKVMKIIHARDLVVPIHRGMEERIRAYMDRANIEIAKDPGGEPYDLESDADLLIAIDVLITKGLDTVELSAGLRGMPWGELLSEEVAREATRRITDA